MLEGETNLTDLVLGAAVEVHRRLGVGFLEKTYGAALAIELRHRGIRFETQVPIDLLYRDESIGRGVIDFLVEERLVVELKATPELHPAHKVQVLVYLEAIDRPLGLLINFHAPRLIEGVKRVIR